MTPTSRTICFIAVFLLSLPAVLTVYPVAGHASPPRTATLDSLVHQYQEVRFNHELHDSYASCVECHHHVTGRAPSNPACTSCHRRGITVPSVECKSCHAQDRFSGAYLTRQNTETRYHIDIPGLTGAYHLRCINCHQAITAGPTGCLDCHVKAEPSTSP